MAGMKRSMVIAVIVAMGLGARAASAGALGIPLDGFLTQFQQWVIGLGFITGVVGLLGYVASLFDNPFSHVLAGSIGFFVKAGLLGGGSIILGAVGLAGGACL
jgi:hypothetical protein